MVLCTQDRDIAVLSGGELQRFAIAIVAVQKAVSVPAVGVRFGSHGPLWDSAMAGNGAPFHALQKCLVLLVVHICHPLQESVLSFAE